jgi:hypothetical protein
MPLPQPRGERSRRLELIAYLQRYGVLSTIFLADLGLLLLSVFLFFMASDYPPMARRFPRLVLVMIIVVTLLDMIKFLRGAPEKTSSVEENDDDSKGIRLRQQLKVFYMSTLIFIFFLFMLFFGLALGTLFFLFFSGWTLGYRNLKSLIFSSVVITGFVYIIFEVIMQSFLPEGLIFTIMGG